MQSASAATWMQLIALGCLLGALGQGIRAIVGLKKINDAVSNTAQSVSDVIEPSRLVTSLLIGAIAGALAAIGLVGAGDKNLAMITAAQVTALLGAGYAGADFIEGFMSRVSADPGAPAGAQVVATGTPAPTPAPAATTSSDDAVG